MQNMSLFTDISCDVPELYHAPDFITLIFICGFFFIDIGLKKTASLLDMCIYLLESIASLYISLFES